MNHKNCGGSIVIDCSNRYVLRSPSVKITSNGVFPGVLQIDAIGGKTSNRFMCAKCNAIFSTKEEFEEELVDTCFLCHEEHSVSKLFFVEGISYICDSCKKKVDNPEKYASMNDKTLMYFGQYLKNKTYPTLLTILMKK